MTGAQKTGLFLIAAALVLPSAAIPFITEYHPDPGICLTSNVFSNLGNMLVAPGITGMNMSAAAADAGHGSSVSVPYRYLFVLGVISGAVGIGILTMSSTFVAAGSRCRKAGVILALAGLCLPVVTMPYITEFRPHPDLCLSSNFIGNFKSMIVESPFISIPYRYLFVLGINAAGIGAGMVVLSSGKKTGLQLQTPPGAKGKK